MNVCNKHQCTFIFVCFYCQSEKIAELERVSEERTCMTLSPELQAKQFIPGNKFKVNGTALHHNGIVTIVDPLGEVLKARAEGKPLSESTTHRPGLVAAFDPEYPETLWWWFAPHQLEKE
jgi:hypothetical protein